MRAIAVSDPMAPRVIKVSDELLYLPNMLTLGRIGIIPLVLYFIDENKLSCVIATLLYSASALTDFLDGYLARRMGRVSLIGKYLDPLADKLLVMATLVWMVPMGRVPAWLVVLLLAREISITALRGIASAEGLILAARDAAKSKTALQMIGIIGLIMHFRYPLLFTPYSIDFQKAGMTLLYISLALSLFSAVEYIGLFVEASNQRRKNGVVVSGADQG